MRELALYAAGALALFGSIVAVNRLVAWIQTTMRAENLAGSATRIDSRAVDGATSAASTYHRRAASPSESCCERCLLPASDVGPLFTTSFALHGGYTFTLQLCDLCQGLMNARPVTLVRSKDLSDMQISAKVLPFPSREHRPEMVS